MLRFLDEDGDGKVAFAEMPNYRGERIFTRLDTNEDGKISKAEFDVAMSGDGKRRHAGKWKHGGFMGHRGPRAE
jgi:Ca2+-binding EF-hand superfamily protein